MIQLILIHCTFRFTSTEKGNARRNSEEDSGEGFTKYDCTFGNTKVYNVIYTSLHGPGSVIGIATGYRLDGLEIESRWGRDFLQLSRPALGPTQPPVQWVLDLFQG